MWNKWKCPAVISPPEKQPIEGGKYGECREKERVYLYTGKAWLRQWDLAKRFLDE